MQTSSLWRTWTITELCHSAGNRAISAHTTGISWVSLIVSCTSSTRPNCALCFAEKSVEAASVHQPAIPACRAEQGADLLSTTEPSPQCAAGPPALPLPALWPHQGWEGRGGLNVCRGTARCYLLQCERSGSPSVLPALWGLSSWALSALRPLLSSVRGFRMLQPIPVAALRSLGAEGLAHQEQVSQAAGLEFGGCGP